MCIRDRDTNFLDDTPAVYESERVRVVEFPEPLQIAINGRKSAGIVEKPGLHRVLPHDD